MEIHTNWLLYAPDKTRSMSGTTLGGVECDHCGHQEPGADGIPIRSQHTHREIHGDFFWGFQQKSSF
jgi:hypothetical protein